MSVYQSVRPPVALRRPEAKPANYRVKLLSAVNSMPPLPTVLNRLLGMLNDDRASSLQIAALIEKDNVLSGSVLRCVNSAYYGLPGRVSSIRQAVTLLGFQAVRNLALAFSMRRMMTSGPSSRKLYAAYSRHALGCAIMTQFLATCTRAGDLEAAFAAGLFHDIGKLLVITAALGAMPEITERWESGEGNWEEAEQEVLEVTHSELSGIVLEGWKLPSAIRDAARYHHDPEAHPDFPETSLTLAHLVQAADAAVNSQGIAVVSSLKRPPEPPDSYFDAIGVSAKQDAVLAQFQKEFEGIQGVFG